MIRGNPANDVVAQEIAERGDKLVTMNLQDLKRYMADPRFTISDPETGRVFTRAELKAKVREGELQEKAEAVQKIIDREQAHYQAVLNHWLPLPEIPDTDAFLQALNPFSFPHPVPAEPDYQVQQNILLDELTQEYKARLPYRMLPEIFARKKAEDELPTRWLQREDALHADYAQRIKQYQADLAHWESQEHARIASLQNLLAGDLAETHRWATDLVESLQFPFDTNCDVFLSEAQTICIHLDLPEIEDVIPTVQKQVTPAGETRTVERSRQERNTDYAYLVIGQCLLIAASLFACLPVAETVKVAAYTQRPRVRESDPLDTYILDIAFSRKALQQFQKPSNLISYVVRLGGRINPQAGNQLGPIPPPSWIT